MGFWKRNWEKISADTVSGLSVRVMAGIIFLLVGIVVFPKIVGPIDNEITKEIIDLVYQICLLVYFILLVFLPTILNSRGDKRQDEIRKLELEKEILELEIQRDNQQSTPDNEE